MKKFLWFLAIIATFGLALLVVKFRTDDSLIAPGPAPKSRRMPRRHVPQTT